MDLSISEILSSDKVQALKSELTNTFEDVIGDVLLENKGQILLRRKLNEYLTFNVLGSTNHVVILKANKEAPYSVSCSCKTFELQNQCVHIAAVLDSIIDQLNGKLPVENTTDVDFSLPKHNSLGAVKPAFVPGNLKSFIIPDAKNFHFNRVRKLFPYLRNIKPIQNISKFKEKNGWTFKVLNNYATFTTHFEVNEKNDVIISCSCNQVNENFVCEHVDTCLEHFSSSYDNAFVAFLNKDVEKNVILSQYGLSLDDAEAKLFKFKSDSYGNVAISEAPEYYVGTHEIKEYKSKIISNPTRQIVKQRAFLPDVSDFTVGLVFVLSHDSQTNIPVYIEAYKSEKNKKGNSKLSKLPLNSEENLKTFSVLPEHQFYSLMDFSFLSFKNSVPFDSNLTYHFTNFKNTFIENTRSSYLHYFYKKVEQHWEILMDWEKPFVIDESKSFHKINFEIISLRKEKLSPVISVSESEKFIILEVGFESEETSYDLDTNQLDIYNGRLIKIGSELFRNENTDIIPLLESMPKGKLYFPIKEKIKVMKEILLPLHVKYNISLPEELSLEVKDLEMVPAIHFREWNEKFLILEPKFYYDNLILDAESEEEVFIKVDDKTFFVSRSLETENAFIQFIKTLHPSFKNSGTDKEFQIPFDDVMKNQWFIQASKLMMDQSIKLVGVSELKKFKYNTSTPKWNMNISSGIDWFDIKINASWGDETLGFKDIKKAILNGQSFVVLGDGSFGMIPEEWIQKYSYLFKISKESKSGIQLSKKHFGIIDLLFDQIDDEVVYAEIQEKKQKLLNIEDIVTAEVPTEIKATLRPYQESGFKWMQVLDEISWGGCLADDMGLGKTLQAISFLVHIKKKYDNPTSLIICPTSLIYNWENEIKKFAPSLRYYIFYGLGRTLDGDHFDEYDLIITSYGNARNDIEALMKFEWEYIILDESQAIKNPDANTTRAMQLLKSRNKFILSGTPIQNNTYDLYAQFNFLNPGLLGSREFFRNEFANPIDKNDDKIAAQTLKNIIKPFLLRRTKSEVALDLPEKTESILWCQMEKEQKSMYDEYKDYFRHTLSQKIEADGIGRSGMYILEGLLRLRQICDDPRLIKDKNRKPSKGAKIIELTREIMENTGEHKMLIFSQFTEMLALIKEELDLKKIQFCYLDGSTSAIKRTTEVDKFQTIPEIKVFLISLKAGGVGLNLTAADYVYIVDPWWNPAVEQQAIDRTHRIGQKNNIFAYKMICKDSVEEKILLLQDKKRKLSSDLISEENAFFKKLTKEDIQYLFS